MKLRMSLRLIKTFSDQITRELLAQVVGFSRMARESSRNTAQDWVIQSLFTLETELVVTQETVRDVGRDRADQLQELSWVHGYDQVSRETAPGIWIFARVISKVSAAERLWELVITRRDTNKSVWAGLIVERV